VDVRSENCRPTGLTAVVESRSSPLARSSGRSPRAGLSRTARSHPRRSPRPRAQTAAVHGDNNRSTFSLMGPIHARFPYCVRNGCVRSSVSIGLLAGWQAWGLSTSRQPGMAIRALLRIGRLFANLTRGSPSSGLRVIRPESANSTTSNRARGFRFRVSTFSGCPILAQPRANSDSLSVHRYVIQ
jgi:hypothetical protein